MFSAWGFLNIVSWNSCMGGISQTSIFRNWFEIPDASSQSWHEKADTKMKMQSLVTARGPSLTSPVTQRIARLSRDGPSKNSPHGECWMLKRNVCSHIIQFIRYHCERMDLQVVYDWWYCLNMISKTKKVRNPFMEVNLERYCDVYHIRHFQFL